MSSLFIQRFIDHVFSRVAAFVYWVHLQVILRVARKESHPYEDDVIRNYNRALRRNMALRRSDHAEDEDTSRHPWVKPLGHWAFDASAYDLSEDLSLKGID